MCRFLNFFYDKVVSLSYAGILDNHIANPAKAEIESFISVDLS